MLQTYVLRLKRENSTRSVAYRSQHYEIQDIIFKCNIIMQIV